MDGGEGRCESICKRISTDLMEGVVQTQAGGRIRRHCRETSNNRETSNGSDISNKNREKRWQLMLQCQAGLLLYVYMVLSAEALF